jgi:putative ABC transport system permease protein
MRDWATEVRARIAADRAFALPPDVIEEVAQHITDVQRHALFQGRSPEEAEVLAERELANVGAIAEAVRRRTSRPAPAADPRAGRWIGLWRDARHAWRLLSARRAYSTVIVLTLAVGIGACTAVFGLFNSLLLGPLPFADYERLVLVWETPADNPARRFSVSAPNYSDWVAETRSFESLGLWEDLAFNVSAFGEPEQIDGIRCSASLFDVLGVRPSLGRVFTPREEAPGHHLAVISDAVWKIHFGADPAVVGKPVRLNGTIHEVIGVMPPGFRFPGRRTGIWVPLSLRSEDNDRSWHSFLVAGRLASGVTFDQARDEVERVGAAMRQRYKENATEGATIERMAHVGLSNTRRILAVLSGAVALVLLIACVNVASLQLAFGLSRRREFVTRLSLGARYAHLVRQVVVESLLIAVLGCTGGVVIALFVTQSIDVLLAPGFRSLPFRGEVEILLDWRVLTFAAAISAMSAMLFALAPLRGIRQQSLQPLLHEGGRGATRMAVGTRRVLVTLEIALAIVVLCGAGLLIRSLSTLLEVKPGLNPDNVLTMEVALPQADPHGPPVRRELCNDLTREASSLPGVITVSAINHLPLSGANSDRILSIEGQPEPAPDQRAYADYRIACRLYFATMSIPILAGRDFDSRDVLDGQQVTIVNRAFADRYFPNTDALGKRFKLGGVVSDNPWLTIVGIVGNIRHAGLEAAPVAEMYRPYSQAASPVMTVVTKTAGDPLSWQRPLRDAIKRVDVDLPASSARSMEDVISQSVAWRQTPMRLLAGFALIGLLLAAVGVYGVLAYYVSQRTRELGVRVALGASKARLVGLVLKQSAAPLLAGVALGVAGSVASGQLLADLLYEVTPSDPMVLSTIVGLLVLVSLISSWLPARRAAMVDPLTALREE